MRLSSSPRRGVALVVVLAFVVLLTGVIVAFFARSMTGRQLSNSSASQMKAAALANSAAEIVIAGFKKEIVDGSAKPAPSYGTASSGSYLYVPTGPAYAVPVRYPVPSATSDLIPNLVRESMSGDTTINTLPAPAVPSNASAVNSSRDPALGGRAITPARWNSHFLIPSKSTLTVADSTPDDSPATGVNFTPPYWVLVTRNGPSVQAAVGSGTGALNDAAASNANYVIGRYAYAVYDEGGLLDMNVAGHPTPDTAPATTGFTSAQAGRKGSLAMADLTQLPTDSTHTLSQPMVDSIVGWRNYASAGLTNSFYPNFGFSSTQSSDWYNNFVVKNTSGFMGVYRNAASNTGPTDQALSSRQGLLKLRASLGFGANALQYMGTFSRGLEQPSYTPPRIRYPSDAPSISAVAASTPPAPTGSNPNPTVDSYLGNNDAAGTQASSGLPYQDVYNPSFLATRVTTAFNRPDGTPANVGDPLVKRKFPLGRLAELKYDATDSTTSITDPTATQNHIKDWFGLSRTSSSQPWTYSHGGTLNGGVYILSLKEVAAQKREPDFAELLKAAINVGSLAKGGPNLHNNQGNYQYTLDTAVDYNILQIMANLVDQADADSYPTVIQIAVSSAVSRAFRGVEDLPYFYRYHPMTVVTRLPSPLLSKSAHVVDWRFTTDQRDGNGNVTNPAGTRFKTSYDVAGDMAVGDPGQAVYLYVPDVWNPHDASTALTGTSADRPASFRLLVVTQDPVAQTPLWLTGVYPRIDGDWYADIPPRASIPGPGISQIPAPNNYNGSNPLAALSTSTMRTFTFSDDRGKLFREPTLLYRSDVPTNSAMTFESGQAFTDANTGVQYLGVVIGQAPISYNAVVDTSKYYGTLPQPNGATGPPVPASATGSYLFQAHSLEPIQAVPTGAFAQYTFRLQYQDKAGNWITYDEKYPDFHGLSAPILAVNKLDFPNSRWMNFYNINQMNDSSTGYDPRTPRFGIGTGGNLGQTVAPFLEAGAQANYNSGTDSGNQTFANSKPTVMITQRPGSDRGNPVSYSNPGMTSDPGKNAQMRWFGGVGFSASNGQSTSPNEFSGLLSQNNPNATILARDNNTTTQLYYEDADGMARRAMGAYSLTGALPTWNSTAAGLNLEGLPEVVANSYTGNPGVGTPKAQSLSRPVILNRPFRSVAEMSYTSRGGPWKQIDFFTPESGDTALLDTFCVNEIPADGIVAGKVNLNTRQKPVLQALIAGTVRDELSALSSAPGYARPALTTAEAGNVANMLYRITTDSTNAWRGPLTNISELVGHFVNTTPTTTSGITDFYTFREPVTTKQYSYAGLSAALDNTVYTNATPTGLPVETQRIQRFHESAVRSLADAGQTRVWNLLIDVIAQTGRYPTNASTLAQFSVEGESRYWVHVAIDRWTGEVIDKQIEIVSE